jgi:hypothetical protein
MSSSDMMDIKTMEQVWLLHFPLAGGLLQKDDRKSMLYDSIERV